MKMKISLNCILEEAKKAGEVIIVGAGKRGKELLIHFDEKSAIVVRAFFDNNETLIGTYINGIEIVKPYKDMKENILYIIAVDEPKIRKELRAQLKYLGIADDKIITYYFYRDYEYMCNLDEKYYEEDLQDLFYERLGKKINWENPVTYNEKINWEKLNVKDERRTRLADKVLVRDWVKEQIGEKYLTKFYGVWDDVSEIDFDSLPNSFVLKTNNGSGRNIIVKDKTQINKEEICYQLNEWKEYNFAYTTYELQYKDIVPKILCEEYLEGVAESVYDYNIYCFHGEPAYVWCIKGSHRPECRASFYTKEWEMMPFSFGYPRDDVLAPKPKKLDEMLELSRILSKDFNHVRVDWYNLPDGRVLFCEMTFSSWSGLNRFNPEEYDTIFGNMI